RMPGEPTRPPVAKEDAGQTVPAVTQRRVDVGTHPAGVAVRPFSVVRSQFLFRPPSFLRRPPLPPSPLPRPSFRPPVRTADPDRRHAAPSASGAGHVLRIPSAATHDSTHSPLL